MAQYPPLYYSPAGYLPIGPQAGSIPSWGNPAATLTTTPATPGDTQAVALTYGRQLLHKPYPQDNRTQLLLTVPCNAQLQTVNQLLGSLLTDSSAAARQRREQLSAMGIHIGAHFDGQTTHISASSPKEYQHMLPGLIVGQLSPENLDFRRFEQTKQQLVTNLDQAQAMPDSQLYDAVNQTLYGVNHPFGKTVAETKAELIRLQPSDILQQLQLMRGQLLGHGTWIASGPIGTTDLARSIEQQIGFFPATQPVNRTQVPFVPVGQQRVLKENTATPYTMYNVVWRTPGINDPDFPALIVMLRMLESQSMGFFEEIRSKRQLDYSPKKQFSLDPFGGQLSLSMQTSNHPIKAGDEAIQSVLNQVLQGKFTPAQLEAGKAMALLNHDLVHENAEASVDRLATLVHTAGLTKPDWDEQPYKQQLQRVDKQAIMRVARRVFGPEQCHSVFGVCAPKADLADFSSWLASPKSPKK